MVQLVAFALLPLVAAASPGAPSTRPMAATTAPSVSTPTEADAAAAELADAVAAKRALLETFLAASPPPSPERVHGAVAPLDRRIASARGILRLADDRRLAAAEPSIRALADLERRLFGAYDAAQDRLRAIAERIDELRQRADGLEGSAARREAEGGIVKVPLPAGVEGPTPGAARCCALPGNGSRGVSLATGHDATGALLWAQEHRDAARAEREEAARLRSEIAALEREAAALAGP